MKTIKPPKGRKSYIDVTKPPYSADNTGKVDCTEAINKVIRDFYQGYLDAFQQTVEKLSAQEDPDALITFEIRKIQGRKNVVFPEHLPQPMVLYFPKGEYLVSDTISYYFEEFRNILGDNRNLEMNGMLRFCGEDMQSTIIRLQDHCPGFGLGADKPVISFMQGRASNIAQSNFLENLTISVGKGNPGATGLLYFANNNGAVRNVIIRSEDPDGFGNTGLAILHDKVSAGYVKNVTVEGFQYGIKVMPQTHFVTFEHITLKNQRRAGFYIGNTVVSIRDLKSENQVTAVWIHGVTAFVLLTDAQLRGGCFTEPAIRYEFGQCLLRNIRSWGYEYNPERSLYEIVNDGGLLWVLGFKTEEEGTAFTTKNGGKTEVLGGSHCCGLGKQVPLLVNENSQVSVFSSTCMYGPSSGFPLAVREVRDDQVICLEDREFPRRFLDSYVFPPYLGDCRIQTSSEGEKQ